MHMFCAFLTIFKLKFDFPIFMSVFEANHDLEHQRSSESKQY